MKSYFLFLVLGIGIFFPQTNDRAEQLNFNNTPQFNENLLNRYVAIRPNLRFSNVRDFYSLTGGINLVFDINFLFPNFAIIPFANTGLSFTPLIYFYSGGINFRITDFLISLGYFGSFSFGSSTKGQISLRNNQDYSNLVFLGLGLNFFLVSLKNQTSYGYAYINNIVQDDQGRLTLKIGEQVINNTDITIYLFYDLDFEIYTKMDLDYQYFLTEKISGLDYYISLNNIFKFDSYMELALIPKFSISFSSRQDKIRNYISFFRYSPSPNQFFQNLLPSSSSSSRSLLGNYILGLDFGWRVFPFSYIPSFGAGKNFYFQPSFYSGLVFNDDNIDSLSKSEATISTVLNLGWKKPYSSSTFALGIGWNNFGGLVINSNTSVYY